MFAIVKIGGGQFKVSEGDTIQADRMPAREGEELTLDQVMLLADGEKVQVGQPYLDNVRVQAKVLGPVSGEKVVAFKYRLRKSSSSKKGSRKKLTALNITGIAVR